MKPPRRSFLHLVAGTAALPVLSYVARAQAYPSRPVRIVVGFAPGGPTDVFARLEASAQFGLGAPKNTPVEIVAKLNKEINASLADPGIKQRFADLAAEVLPVSPAEFGKLVADETEKWAKVVRFSGAKPD